MGVLPLAKNTLGKPWECSRWLKTHADEQWECSRRSKTHREGNGNAPIGQKRPGKAMGTLPLPKNTSRQATGVLPLFKNAPLRILHFKTPVKNIVLLNWLCLAHQTILQPITIDSYNACRHTYNLDIKFQTFLYFCWSVMYPKAKLPAIIKIHFQGVCRIFSEIKGYNFRWQCRNRYNSYWLLFFRRFI